MGGARAPTFAPLRHPNRDPSSRNEMPTGSLAGVGAERVRARAPLPAHPKVRALRCPPGPHGICNGKKIPWEGELNLRFDP